MLALFAVLATVPFWIARVGLYPYLGVEIVIWATYALAYNLTLGRTGLPSFGHGAYFGIGAYAFGLAQLHLWPSLWFCLAAALLAATVAGAAVGLFISHRRGIYYAFMTIAFGQVFWFVAVKSHALTGGEDGLLKIRRLPVELGFATVPLDGNDALYWFALVAFALVAVLLWRLVHSPFGRVLNAIRQNELRAAFVGYHVWAYKLLAFAVSAGLSGLAGALFAMAQTSAFPDVMSLHWSGIVVMMTLVGGGLVSFWGPVVGVVLFFVARDVLGAVTASWMLWFGLMFMAVVMFRPEGVAGAWQAWRARRAAASRAALASAAGD
ncbi:MAG: branched-chain amino acid ABC transporter permease [Alphaproteobacteria bacterium]|nr:branched-chain amino acid ABC transporter permease [Alphaproteobacteria bacterium]